MKKQLKLETDKKTAKEGEFMVRLPPLMKYLQFGKV